MRHSELERIIHISIISLPLYGPLLSNLMAFLAFPRLQQFIPAAAVRWREIEEIRTVKKHEFRNLQREKPEVLAQIYTYRVVHNAPSLTDIYLINCEKRVTISINFLPSLEYLKVTELGQLGSAAPLTGCVLASLWQ